MAKLNHMVRKSAVAKYGKLLEEGKSPQEIRDAIKGDEKEFPDEHVEEIYTAIIGAPEQGNEGDKGDKGADNGGNKGADQGEDKGPDAATAKNKKGKGSKYIVATPFRDINDFSKEYVAGEDVSHFDAERLERLVKNGHVTSDK